MAINPNIRDQAYQFFIEEAPELLQILEAGLLTLRQEKNTAKVHALMRAAHSLKGGAASVELEAIKTLAHRLENIFKALYNDTIEIDTNLESQLLQAYDCLRLPLMEQIQTGYFDPEQALVLAEPLFVQIEDRLGDALTQADTYIPSSSELGIDMAQSIFEVDVGEGLERLAEVAANPQKYEVGGELRAQAEVFAGFAELLNQPGFGAIAHTALAALDAHPERALAITQLALADFEFARQTILTAHAQGTNVQQISPSAALLTLAHSTATQAPDCTVSLEYTQEQETVPSLEHVLSTQLDENLPLAQVSEDTYNLEPDGTLEAIFATAPLGLNETVAETNLLDEVHPLGSDQALEEIFANAPERLEQALTETEVPEETQPFEVEGVLEAIFANAPELLAEPLTATELPTHALDSCEIVDVDLTLAAHAPSITDETVGELPVAIKHIIDEQKPKSTLELSQNPLQLQQA